MFRIKTWSLCALAVTLLATACFGEDAVPPKFYKLDFVVREMEGGKVLNARGYSMTASDKEMNGHSETRTGSKVPYSTTADGSQYTFLDVGVNFDCYHIVERRDAVSLVLVADISSVIQEPGSTSTPMRPPMVRQNKWNSGVVVPFRKPTVVFSSDDLTTKRQMQVELTATPIL
jgi:hypothetical protein